MQGDHSMKIHTVAISITALVLAAVPVLAQSQPQRPAQAQPAAGKPYKAVTISAPPQISDASFEAFRKQLGAVAEKKDRKALAGLVVQDFFWLSEKGDRADKKKPGIDNLAKAIQLDGKDAPGWELLGAAAGDPTGTPYPDRKDTICAPADPTFSMEEFEALIKSTGTEEDDWAFPAQQGIEVHASAQPNSPVVEKLGLHFIRVLQEQTAQQSPMIRILTPSGKTGFVSPDALNPLGNDQLCFSKDAGGWKVSGFVGGEP
jgi:hypothetical protein